MCWCFLFYYSPLWTFTLKMGQLTSPSSHGSIKKVLYCLWQHCCEERRIKFTTASQQPAAVWLLAIREPGSRSTNFCLHLQQIRNSTLKIELNYKQGYTYTLYTVFTVILFLIQHIMIVAYLKLFKFLELVNFSSIMFKEYFLYLNLLLQKKSFFFSSAFSSHMFSDPN